MPDLRWRQGRKVDIHVYEFELDGPTGYPVGERDDDQPVGTFLRAGDAALAVSAVNRALAPMGELPLNAVPAMIFKASGKWAYDCLLDYTYYTTLTTGGTDYGHIAQSALMAATRAGTSQVSFETLPDDWTMVVPQTPHGLPVLTRKGQW